MTSDENDLLEYVEYFLSMVRKGTDDETAQNLFMQEVNDRSVMWSPQRVCEAAKSLGLNENISLAARDVSSLVFLAFEHGGRNWSEFMDQKCNHYLILDEAEGIKKEEVDVEKCVGCGTTENISGGGVAVNGKNGPLCGDCMKLSALQTIQQVMTEGSSSVPNPQPESKPWWKLWK